MSMLLESDLLYKPYPVLAIEALQPALEALPMVDTVVTRLLKPIDPNGCVGITIVEWVPGEPLIGRFEPAMGEYSLLIQALTKNTDESEGNIYHYSLADSIKRMLFRDEDLIAALKALVVDDDQREHTSRWGVSFQRLMGNEIDQQFVFLSGTQLFFTTEIAC